MDNNTVKNSAPMHMQERFEAVFSYLQEQDVEQFYASYQIWVLRHRIPMLEKQIEALREHIQENQQIIQNQRPPAIALAVLARLQSKGVSNTELLDQMLEQGEDWLDRMMQRLDYCEQVEDFIQGDYTQWCLNSLEGAYDWIDSLREDTAKLQVVEKPDEAEIMATEELLLQRLRTDDEEAMLEVTLKYPAIRLPYKNLAQKPALADESPASPEPTEITPEAEIAVIAENETAADESDAVIKELSPLTNLADWEDLESVSEPSAPWYNMLEPDLSPSFNQPHAMDDWLKVLEADIAAQREAVESNLPTEEEEEVSLDLLAQPDGEISSDLLVQLDEESTSEPNETAVVELAYTESALSETDEELSLSYESETTEDETQPEELAETESAPDETVTISLDLVTPEEIEVDPQTMPLASEDETDLYPDPSALEQIKVASPAIPLLPEEDSSPALIISEQIRVAPLTMPFFPEDETDLSPDPSALEQIKVAPSALPLVSDQEPSSALVEANETSVSEEETIPEIEAITNIQASKTEQEIQTRYADPYRTASATLELSSYPAQLEQAESIELVEDQPRPASLAEAQEVGPAPANIPDRADQGTQQISQREAASIPQKPQKRGFWRWLFGRKSQRPS